MWKIFSLVLFLLSLSTYTQGSPEHEITYPERLHHSRHKRDLSTATEDGHEDSASFAVNAFNKRFILDTKNNRQLIPKSFLVRQFDSNDNEVISREYPEACHYQGSIRGNPDSVVVLNTCSGLTGLLDDGKDTYHIQPHDDDKENGAHKIHLVDDEDEFDAHQHCGTPDEDSSDSTSSQESKIKSTIARIRRGFGHVVDMEEVYRPYLTTDETRYNEVLFVVDNGVYQRFNSNSKTVTDKVATLCNAVDAVYQRINIRIVMSALEIWSNGDRMPRKPKGEKELGPFNAYRQAHLVGKIHHDNAQFLSHRGWGRAAGVAYVGGMCGSNSAGINRWKFTDIRGPLVVLAHEMGHNFGFAHNTDACKCLTPKGCFMGGHKTRVPGFSDCNLDRLKKINDKCLYNVPEQALNARCGNGIREGDEECDCGTPEMCAAKDPCCLPHACRLKPSSQCSDLHHSCCSSCLYKKQGTLCRAAQTDCDVPEHCTGDSGDCPSNTVMQDGVPCNRTNKLILANTNRNSVVTRKLTPPIQARYIRINPQYWEDTICMRTGLLGCSPDEVNPTNPTPIKAYNDFCVAPQNEACNAPDNTKIIFKSGYQCKEKYMEFQLDASGTLWHACSKKRVCTENGKTGNGVKLVISSTCTDEDSKFMRTSGHSLKHSKSGKCIHSNGGRPGNNRELIIHRKCDEERLQLWFMKPDCLLPLGVSNGEIKDSQITASSYRSNDLPKYGRLRSSKYWCAAGKGKTEYLQIDLGKTQTIAHVQTQGRGSWNNWVTAYYLQYSQDGYRWTGYSASGDGLYSNSNCYLGKCAETRETQCRDLWGPEANNAVDGCYDKLNTEAKGYGTCDPFSNSPCAAEDVQCGQLQCRSFMSVPLLVNYGKSYTKVTLGGSYCSAAVLDNKDSVGDGMVHDGTKCGDGKMCSNFKCKTFNELNIKSCFKVNGELCNGQGDCTSTGECHCYEGYDPKTGCVQALVAVDGGFGDWSDWSTCTAGCNGGKQQRYRFCNNPFPKHGGKDCSGHLQEEQNCNTAACPKAYSCRHLHSISKNLPDGVYDIYPRGVSNQPIKTYCDMSRDGAGWTLLVTSHTNSWTASDVTLRNSKNPSLTADFSILKYADEIKDNVNVLGTTFEYRLEAQRPGRWGGIWEADRSYSFTAKTNGQTNVRLLKKFDNWNYDDKGIEQRMPWISGATLSTSKDKAKNAWGTITGNNKIYHPAPWISGTLMETQPEYIWYWMREGPRKD